MSKKAKLIRAKLIVNPAAGNAADANKNLELAIGYLKNNGFKADVAKAKPKSKATPIAKRAIKDGYKVVIALGGDGTVEAVMRGMVGSKARLGIIPVGMENNIAKNLGIPLDLKEACALIASDDTIKLDVGQVKTGKVKWFPFFEMVGIGLSTAMYPSGTNTEEKDFSGIQSTAQSINDEDVMPKVFLNLDDESIQEVNTMLVMVTNTAVFGKKFQVTPNAALKDGYLDISVFQGFSKGDLHGYYASILNGSYSGTGTVGRFQARKLKVKSSPKLKVKADGIDLGVGTVTIKMVPGALRVITKEKTPSFENTQTEAVEPLSVPPLEEKVNEPSTVNPLQ